MNQNSLSKWSEMLYFIKWRVLLPMHYRLEGNHLFNMDIIKRIKSNFFIRLFRLGWQFILTLGKIKREKSKSLNRHKKISKQAGEINTLICIVETFVID